ncbi:hypothetical protein VTJ04DRAFT_3694 [Mycothermus thermophilus]|uniref:uncharacterized protein n=1 Tax=Humicola insolens TaxID=85995 RepID=UPI0037440A2D
MGSRLEKNSAAMLKRIAEHQFTDEDGEEYEASEFGGFGDYFRRKKVKLQNLDAELRAQAADKPQIFKGVVAHVIGYTQPSLQVLHRELVQHGAGFLQYLDGKTVATHIIASAMPPKKAVDFSRYRVVRPAWVMDSIAAGRLLPWSNYRVIDDGPRQKTIKFDDGKLSTEASQQSPTGYREQTQNSFYTGQFQKSASRPTPQASSSPFSVPSAQKPPRPVVPPGSSSPSFSVPSAQKPRAPEPVDDSDDIDTDMNGDEEPAKLPEKPERHSSDEHMPAVQDPPAPAGHGPPDKPPGKPMTSEEHNALLLQDPKIRKSSTANPDFLKQYYSESRLHHLSTWKAELKSRLMKMMADSRSRSGGAPTNPTRRKPGARRYILHVDFDSFFCAVSLRDHAPEWRDKPAVVAHSTGSGSEIASCNYPARKFGVKNGMWMKRALELCPDLKVVPYDFPAYEEASRRFYDAILNVGGVVQSVSIDEALIDATDVVLSAVGSQGIGVDEGSVWREQAKADEIASNLRAEIKKTTDCHVSVGIGGNILLAKVALRKAKPAGQHQIRPEEVLDVLADLRVQDLPGVAYSIGGRLEEMGITLVKDLRQTPKERLVAALGPKTGEKLWEYARGIDRAEVGEQPMRKSVSADVNWGIRFVSQDEAEEFVRNLCKELERRLLNEGVKGRHLTMKIMRRSPDAPLDPAKHLGHGKCDTFTKSVSFGVATNDAELLGKEAVAILRSYKFSPGDLRGLGVQMTKLEPIKASSAAPEGGQRKLTFGGGAGVAPKRLKTEPIEESGSGKTAPPPKRTRTEPNIEDDFASTKSHRRSAAPEFEDDPITVDPLTPRKPKVHPALALARANAADEKAVSPLNIAGTQFIIPSNPDPAVLAELPHDIRRRLVHPAKRGLEAVPSPAGGQVRAQTPSVPAVGQQTAASTATDGDEEEDIPSDVDPEVFRALPEDVKAEVRAAYGHRNKNHRPPAVAAAAQQRPTTRSERASPAKRGGGGGGGGGGGIKNLFDRARERQQQHQQQITLTAAGISRSEPQQQQHQQHHQQQQQQQQQQPQRGGGEGGGGGGVTPADFLLPDELDPEFLAELPEDVRRDVIEDHKRRMKLRQKQQQQRAAAAAAAAAQNLKPQLPPQPPPNQPRVHFPAKPRRLPFPTQPNQPPPPLHEMKETLATWHASAHADGPESEDVDVFARYLARVATEERDLEKVRGLVRWLEWLVEEGEDGEGKERWTEAVGRVKEVVDEAVKGRGLGGLVW